ELIRSDITTDSSSSNLVNNKQEYININSATYNQLCTIPSLTPILIKRIIERRERKGPFRFVEDLLKIKGINYIVLASIRSYITVDDRQIPISVSQSSILEPSVNNLYPTLNKNNNNITSDSLSLASLLLLLLLLLFVSIGIFDLVGLCFVFVNKLRRRRSVCIVSIRDGK
ncbi:unnamed protein product, partial [Rotaria sp. Silwood1]